MDSHPSALSTALPSLSSRRQSNAPPASQLPRVSVVDANTTPTTSALVRQASVKRSSDSISSGVSLPTIPNTGAKLTSSFNASTAPAPRPTLETAEDVEMHYVVSQIKARNLDAFKKWAKEARHINLTDFAGNTPLHWACHKGLPEFVAALLRRKADPNIANRNHAAPLHCAAISGVKSIIDMLLQHGADAMLPNGSGKNFFQVLRSKGHAHLEVAYEALEERLLTESNPAPLASSDSWFDAARLGAETESDTDFNGTRDSQAVVDVAVVEMPSGEHMPSPIAGRSTSFVSTNGGDVMSMSADDGRGSPQPRSTRLSLRAAAGAALAVSSSPMKGMDQESSYSAAPAQGPLSSGMSVSTRATNRSLSASETDLERRIRYLEEHALAAAPPSGAPHAGDVTIASQLVTPTVGGLERHTVPPAWSGSKGPLVPQAYKTVSPRTDAPVTISPQRVVGPNGRLLCCGCDEAARKLATAYCEECRRSGDSCWLCDACWQTEHTSKRTRHHRKGPVPIPQQPSLLTASTTPRGSLFSEFLSPQLFPFDLSALTPEARAYLLLQQQLLQALSGQQQSGVATQSSGVGGSACAETVHVYVQTVEPLKSTYFDEAMLELNDVREQLEAEVSHSQQLIDSTRLQLLEAMELRHRSEIESSCWRRLLNLRRPPQVVTIFNPNPVPLSLAGVEQQHAGPSATAAFNAKVEERVLLMSRSIPLTPPPPMVNVTVTPAASMLVQPGQRKKQATASASVQCHISPNVASVAIQTAHSGDSAPPPKQVEGTAVAARYADDAVDMVHGEKHLPDQPQMLLVRWARGGLESWVPAYEVAHCTAVVAYLSRYDKSFNNSERQGSFGTPMGGKGLEGFRSDDVSPLNESERTQLSLQLAALKRAGTANRDSRESSDQLGVSRRNANAASSNRDERDLPRRGKALPGDALNGDLPPSRGVLPASFEPTDVVAVDDEDIPMPPDDALDDQLATSPVPPDTPDTEIVKRYEERLRSLEERQSKLRRLREEQIERISHLKNKQQLVNEHRRADVHRQYEAKASELSAEQPEKMHPLQSTTDRHAALVLHELQAEVMDAERHKKERGQQEPATTEVSASGKPPLAGRRVPTQSPPKPPPLDSPRQQQLPSEPTFEQKINRILYEQYFFNKAHAADAARRQGPKEVDSIRPASLN